MLLSLIPYWQLSLSVLAAVMTFAFAGIIVSRYRGRSRLGALLFTLAAIYGVTGCSVLDIGDQNGHYDSGFGHEASPGLRWAAVPGVTILLGYNYTAPLDSQGSVDIIRNWCNKRFLIGDVAAWMEANDNRHGRNACAIEIADGVLRYWYFKKLMLGGYRLEHLTMEGGNHGE